MSKILLCAFFCMILLRINAGEPDLLFYLGFDHFQLKADHSAGDPLCQSINNTDLQLRPHAGVAGKGNALALANQENGAVFNSWKNISARQGTISLWVAPKNWRPSDIRFQIFFSAIFPGGKRLLLYKFLGAKLRFAFTDDANKTSKYIEVSMPDNEWPLDAWHKLDAVWDSREMRLYVDGNLPPTTNHYTLFNPLLLTEPLPLPEGTPDSIMALGMNRTFIHEGTDITVYDELKIYGRALTALEIRQAFEKFYPPQPEQVETALVQIPQLPFRLPLEAKLNEGVWSQAARIPVRNFIKPVKESNEGGYVLLGHDGRNLFLGLHVDKSPAFASSTARDDDGIWQCDDGLELHLIGGDGKQYQFIINPRGAIWDQRVDIGKAWNADLQQKTSVGTDFWTAALAIPFAQLGFDGVPDEMLANLGITRQNPVPTHASWAQTQEGYGNRKFFGCFRFTDSAAAVQVRDLGALEYGRLHIEIDKSENITTKALASLTNSRGQKIENPGNFDEAPWQLQVPSGIWKLAIQVQAGEQILLRQGIRFHVNQPLETTFKSLPSQQRILVESNIAGAPEPVIGAMKEGKLRARASLLDDEENLISTQEYFQTDYRSERSLALPENLEPGQYKLKCRIEGADTILETDAPFQVPDMTPYKVKSGDDGSVPKPWVQIRKTDKHTFSMWDRDYLFNEGPLPGQIISGGGNMFLKPPLFKIDLGNGEHEVAWEKFKLQETRQDHLVFTGSGKATGLNFQWQGELWFDGMWKLNLTIQPENQNPVKIHRFSMQWTVAKAFARFVLQPLYVPWPNNNKPLNLRFFEEDFLLWTTSTVRGLAWMPLSRANWYGKPGEKQIHLTRKDDTIEVRADLISLPVQLTQKAEYSMLLMATPGKPLPAKWRDLNNGHMWGRASRETFKICGYGNPKDAHPFTMHPWNGFQPWNPERFQKYLDELAQDKIVFIPYSQPAATAKIEEGYDYFYPEWAQVPGPAGGSAHDYQTGQIYQSLATCAHTGSGDLFAGRAQQILDKYPELGGLYYDISQVCQCSNQLHGHGGIDSFGQKYTSSNALSLRHFFLRIRRITSQRGKLLILHAHNRFIPFVHGMGDAWFPGEQYNTCLPKNNDHFYCEEIPMEEYQSSYYSPARGSAILFFAPLQLQQWLYPGTPALDDIPHTLMYLAPILLHDTNTSATYAHQPTIGHWWDIKHDVQLANAEFHGYWFDDTVKSASDSIYCSWYNWQEPSPYSHLIIAANLTRNPIPAKLDFRQLQLDTSNCKFVDVWQNLELQVTELEQLSVQPNNFLLIGIQPVRPFRSQP